MGLKLSDNGWWPKVPPDSTVGSQVPTRAGFVIPSFGWLDMSDSGFNRVGSLLVSEVQIGRQCRDSSGAQVPSFPALWLLRFFLWAVRAG